MSTQCDFEMAFDTETLTYHLRICFCPEKRVLSSSPSMLKDTVSTAWSKLPTPRESLQGRCEEETVSVDRRDTSLVGKHPKATHPLSVSLSAGRYGT
jgi:hypothetical protein